jgi:glycosyltransferase 2 family protein
VRRLRIQHLWASPWLRGGLAAVAVGFGVYGLVQERAEAGAALHHLDWYAVAGAIPAAAAGLGCMMLAWRALLADLGSPLPPRVAARVMFVGQLGKYIPGALWAIAAQTELARERGVPRERAASATLVAIAVTNASGLITAVVVLPLASVQTARYYWWVLACVPLLLVALYPPVLGAIIDRGLRLLRQPALERRISLPGVARCVGWSLLGWAFYSIHLWLLVGNVTGRGIGVLPLSAGAYALGYLTGFVLILFPGGLGPRELAMMAVLAPVMPRGSALLVAVVSRVVMTIADFGWAGAGLVLGPSRARTDQPRAGATSESKVLR